MKLVKKNLSVFTLITLSLLAHTSDAEELLIVDLSTPDKVTITATSGVSSATVSGGDSLGLYMANFFAIGQNTTFSLGSSVDTSNLTSTGDAAGSQPRFFRAGSGTDPGLNLYNWSSASTVSFTIDEVAFTGSGTWSVSESAHDAMLVGGNRVGDIYFPADSLDDVATATLIGQYRVVVSPTLNEFTYDPSSNTFDVSIQGSPNKDYIFVEADDLDFSNPDQSPISLSGATASIGSLNTVDNTLLTDGEGNATVEGVSLGGTAKNATFIRAEVP